MSDKKKGKQRNFEEKPSKEEYAVAKYLCFSLPAKEGKLHGMDVKCFIGNMAVDKLLESKWSAAKNAKDPLFTNRISCVSYMLRLLQKGLFHRAEREKRKKDNDKEKEKSKKKKKEKEVKPDDGQSAEEGLRERKGKKDKKSKKEKEETPVDDTDKKDNGEKKVEKKEEKKKKEKRLKLIMPDQQFFEDGDEVYVWIYDPVNAKTFFIGLLMVLGAIGLCMFPLWPQEVRVGVYYLSLTAAGFVGFILSLVVVRLILFCCIWVLTLGKHHFWFLPNLTEDVGFLDSFRPLYEHEVAEKGDNKVKDSSKKKKKKKDQNEKGSLKEEVSQEPSEKPSDKDDSDEFEMIKKEDIDENGADIDMEEGGEGDDDDINNYDGAENDDDEDEECDNEAENGETEEEEELNLDIDKADKKKRK